MVSDYLSFSAVAINLVGLIVMAVRAFSYLSRIQREIETIRTQLGTIDRAFDIVNNRMEAHDKLIHEQGNQIAGLLGRLASNR